MFAAMGKNGQFINVVPSMNLVYIRMGEAPGSNPVPFTINDTIWQKLNDVFCTPSALHSPDEKSIRVFPNPAQSSVTVDLPQESYDLALSDLTGRVLFVKNNNRGQIEIPCEEFAAGLYILKVRTAQKELSAKLFKE